MSFFDKPLFLYRPPYGKHYHEDFETLRFMIDAGVRTVVLSPMNTLNSFGEPYSEHPPIWKWFQTCDFNILESLIQEVLKISPEIRFILTIDLNSPQWLSRRLLLDSFYSLGEISLHSRWKEETSAYLRAFINYCETRHRERVCGYISLPADEHLNGLNPGTTNPVRSNAPHTHNGAGKEVFRKIRRTLLKWISPLMGSCGIRRPRKQKYNGFDSATS